MVRKIVHIDEKICNGCGICVNACHEGAIEIIDGKAKLMKDDYCDGLGDCLPGCPVGAITIEEREAAAYDPGAVQVRKAQKREKPKSQKSLMQWPTQIKLVPGTAPYYDGARLLVAADCTAFAYSSMHEDFIRDHVTINGCPKLDGVDYSEKLTQIVAGNDIKEVTVTRMVVPCCGGLEHAVKRAIQASGKNIPCHVVVISTDGKIVK